MKFQGITGNFTEANVDALAVVVFKGEKTAGGVLKDLDKLTGGLIAAVIKNEEFKGEKGDTALLRFAAKGAVKASRLMLVGVGEKSDYTVSDVTGVAGAATRYIRARNIKSFALLPRSEADAAEIAQNAVQGFVTSQFELDKYKTKDKNEKAVTSFVVCVDGAKPADLKSGITRGQVIGDSMNFTRDLANEPPNILHPTEMARRAQVMAKEVGLKCEIMDGQDDRPEIYTR
jgi:leucyl aminopeptidase